MQEFSDMPEQVDIFQKLNQLKESKILLQSVFDTTLIGISVMKAVLNESGTIVDFRIEIINQELEKVTGRKDLVGKLYAQEYPGIKETGLFNVMLGVMATGIPGEMEYFYQHDGFEKWFHSMFVKSEDGLVATNQDITTRKKAELEREKNYTLLQQAERIAGIGSWDFDLQTQVFSWSEGMYRLFDLDKNIEVQPEIYLQYVTKETLPIALLLVNNIRTAGIVNFEDTLDLSVEGTIKKIKVKASIVYNSKGESIRIIGVDADITLQEERVKLENNYKKMEASRDRMIFQATLNTQEQERKRIAESLHNGIGQLLYGVKLSLAQLNFDKEHIDFEWLKNAKRTTDNLLTETIKESRRVSHELTPTILEDFGLKAALDEVCQQSGAGLSIKCTFIGSQARLNSFVEIVIYRTVQELVMNILKHAKASWATVNVNISAESVILTVQDDGIGFKDYKKSNGIGIKTIQNKIRFLNGSFKLSPENNLITISIPIVQD